MSHDDDMDFDDYDDNKSKSKKSHSQFDNTSKPDSTSYAKVYPIGK